MRYLILDTNTWIYLANSQDPTTSNFNDGLHFKLFRTLNTMVENGDVRIVINKIIIEEWNRNKERAELLIKRYKNLIITHVDTLAKMQKECQSQLKNEYNKISAEYTVFNELKIKENEQHIQAVEKLLSSSIQYEISNDSYIKASEQALAKKAPFIGDKKNSTADAIIFFSAIEFVKKITKGDELGLSQLEAFFVSGNKGDFSDPKNPDKIHPDLKPHMDEIDMRYFRSLMPALNQIEQSVFEEEEQYRMEEELEQQHYHLANVCIKCSQSGFDEYNVPIIDLSEPFTIENELECYDPNQYKLLFEDEIVELVFPQPYVTTTQIGYCGYCDTLHVKCHGCGEINTVDEVMPGFTCEGCGLNYQVENADKYDSFNKEIIKIVEEIKNEETWF